MPSDQLTLDLLPADRSRIALQRRAVFAVMSLGGWWTLALLAERTGYPEASVSARIRDFRKAHFGGHTVSRKRAFPGSGTWLYRLEVKP